LGAALKAAENSAAVLNRSSGAGESALRVADSTASGTSAPICRRPLGGVVNRAAIMPWVAPVCGA
jgi:hypothetical protein